MNHDNIVCILNVVSPIVLVVFSERSCLKPKVASAIVSVTLAIRFMLIYKVMLKNVHDFRHV